MVAGDVTRCLLFATIPLVGTLPWLYVATVLIECAALFWMPAKDATVPNLVPRRRLEAANQVSLATTYGTAPIAAVAFAGLALLSGIVDNRFPALVSNPANLALYANALTFLVSAMTISRLEIPKRTSPIAAAQIPVWRAVVDGWRFVGTTPVVRGLVIGMLGAFAAGGFVIGPARQFVSDLGAGDPGFAVLFGAVFVGLAGGMWMGPRLLAGFSRRRLFGLSLALAGVFLVLLAVFPNMVVAALLTTLLGAFGGVAWVTGYTLLGLEVDDEVRGRTFAFLQSSARVVLVLVLTVAPALAALVGRHTVRFTDTFSLTYSGAAFVFLLAGGLAVAMGVAAYRQMDDRAGTALLSDLRTAWRARPGHGGPTASRQGYPGRFIAFEGGDGTGKSSQARLLADWLRDEEGHDVVLTREPGATPVGVQLRELLLGHSTELGSRAEALLFASDRAHHVAAVVRPALARGAMVVTDRYVDSSIAYQGGGRELDVHQVEQLSRWATGGLVPDLTVVLDLPVDLAARRLARDTSRSGQDRMEAQPTEFHERARERFLELAGREPHRYLVLDASLTSEELQAQVRDRVREVVPISARRRAELSARLVAEQENRRRRASADVEVLRIDPQASEQQVAPSPGRVPSRQRAREDAERELQREAERTAAQVLAQDPATRAVAAAAGEADGTQVLDLGDEIFGEEQDRG
jgi:dTMP kinase